MTKFNRPYLFFLLLGIACTSNAPEQESPPPLYSQAKTITANPEGGYTFNTITGDSIQPIILPNGDTLATGVPVPARSIMINSDSVAKPQVFKVPPISELTTINAHPNVHKIPKELTVNPVNRDSLTAVFLEGIAENDTTHYLLNSSGKKVKTGVPIPAQGKLVKVIQPKPIKPLPLRIKDNAIHNIQYLDVDQGMASSFVYSTLKDQNGNIWFGTSSGVSKYDGESFVHYSKKDGLVNSGVSCMLEDQDGNIWFGTPGGVSRYDGESVLHFSEKEGLTNNRVTCMLEDQNGNLWFGTPFGVSKYDGESFIHYSEKEGLTNYYISSIIADQSGNIWLGTNKGATLFNGETFVNYSEKEGLCNNRVNIMLVDKSRNIWFGTYQGGLIKYDGKSFVHYTEKEGLSKNNVNSMLEDESGNIWFGTYGGGLSKYDGESFEHFTEAEGLSNNVVFSILEDQSGNLWFGTLGGGVSKYDRKSFVHFSENEGLSYKNVSSILEDQSGNIWFGTVGGGVSKYDGENFVHYTEKEGLSDNRVLSMIEDQNRNLWFGTVAGGVCKFDGESFENYTDKEGLSNNRVVSMLEDQSGNLWFGTFDGLNRYDGESFIHYIQEGGLFFNRYRSMLEDQSGNLWFRVVGGGLSKFDGENLVHYTEKEGLSHNGAMSLTEDHSGNLWMGTPGGLSKYDGENFVHYSENEGLSSNSVTSILEDKNKNLWIGTLKGLNRFAFEEAGQASDEQNGISISKYEKSDGLKAAGIMRNCVLADSKNRIWWSTGTNLTMLDLNNFSVATAPPAVHLKHIDINGQFIDYRTFSDSVDTNVDFEGVQPFENYPLHLELSHDKNHLSFHFSAIDWAAPHKIQYIYKMKGLNAGWSQPSKESKAEYRNISPGTYTFSVRAIGESNKWSEPFEYEFTVNPPWWATWWMYLVYGITLLAAVSVFSRWKSKELVKKNELLEETVKNRTVEIQEKNALLSQQTEKLLQLDEAKTKFYTNITHEFRTPLTVIKGMTDALIEKVESGNYIDAEKSLELIDRNGSKLLLLVNEMLDLAKLETGNMELDLRQADIIPYIKYLSESFHSLAEQKSINLTVYAELEHLKMDFDAKKLASIISNLISNAIKYTPKYGKIIIHLNKVNTKGNELFSIKVNDTGIGLATEDIPNVFNKFYQVNDSSTRPGEGTGIGLSLVKELVLLMNGTINVESTLGVGSSFIVKLPIGNLAKKVQEPMRVAGVVALENLSQTTEEISETFENSDLPLALIIEDNKDVAYYIENCLNEKYLTIHAENGKLGLEKAYEHIPDIIISDVMMPEMDGFEACNILKQDERTNHIPIILLTAKATPDDKLSGLSHGADAYLIKPFEKNELLLRMDKLMEIRKTLQAKYSGVEAPEVKAVVFENSFVKRFYEITEEHILDDDFTIEDLADNLHLSRSQVHRKIKGLTGMSTSLYVRHIRLQKAKALLTSTDLNISEIAYQTGFKTPVYFSQVFKESFGIPPSEARENG